MSKYKTEVLIHLKELEKKLRAALEDKNYSRREARRDSLLNGLCYYIDNVVQGFGIRKVIVQALEKETLGRRNHRTYWFPTLGEEFTMEVYSQQIKQDALGSRLELALRAINHLENTKAKRSLRSIYLKVARLFTNKQYKEC